MTDVKVELDLLERASKTWHEQVAVKLTDTATSIENVKYPRTQFGIFIETWNAYAAAAQYIQERLREGASAAQQISDTLHTVAANYAAQEDENARGLQGVDAQLQEYTI
ncbi:type VII secretion target [Aldersonia kunmingensis]|uniref:type VII secretion target n=1 Tax=Aldersonia kunmingensis TaxID=408066 RepID=UPI000829D1A7|nr:type VII secretion target [Aldersonia kunmingensis]